MSVQNPQNPYGSYLVAASAGSGKTYQLSRRFLFLVGAGAAPASILTVTFTKKAAGEMRGRILEDAVRLAASPAEQAAFAADQRAFHAEAARARPELRLPPPRAPVDAARAVLAASQVLRVSTIDSLFLEWVSKFPFEATSTPPGDEDDGAQLPSPLALLDTWQRRRLDVQAWQATGSLLARARGRGDEGILSLLAALDHDLAGAEPRLRALTRMETFLWYAERGGAAAFLPHPLPACPAASEAELVAQLAPALTAIVAQLGQEERRERCLAAIRGGDLEGLFAAEILTRAKLGVSGTYIKGKKREALAAEVDAVEGAVRAFTNRRRIERMNAAGEACYELYRYHRRLRDHLKSQAGVVEFADLAKGCYRLFRSDAGLGVRFLLARTTRHLLLDEFQDTSRLQWGIFHELAAQLLAGDGAEDAQRGEGPPPTVFIVGDEKQSIYGFREADPGVLGDAADALADRLERAPLSRSYRTAQVVLDYVNRVFGADPDAAFPPHATAETAGGRPVVPDCGRVLVAPLLGDELADGDIVTPADAREARLVAALIARAVRGEVPCPVFDKRRGVYRRLRAEDCAVLYRASTKAQLFEDALRAEGIACRREEEHGFFARTEVADAVALLRFLAVPSDLVSLLTVLQSPLGRLPDAAVLALLDDTRAAAGGARGQKILTLLRDRHPEVGAPLFRLAARAGTCLPHELLAEALDRLSAFAAYGDGALPRRNLCRLLEICMQLEDAGHTSLVQLAQRLEFLGDEDETGSAEAGGGGVTLMTIHKSKGLEFPLVVLADSARAWGKRDVYWAQAAVAGADAAGYARRGVLFTGSADERPIEDAAFERLTRAVEQEIREECQRLLYVALTRARQYLVVTGHEAGRSSGVSDTAAYARLAEALEGGEAEDGRTAATLAVESTEFEHGEQSSSSGSGPIELRGWSSLPYDLEFTGGEEDAAPDTARTVAADAPVAHDPELPSQLKLVSPSRHDEVQARAGATTRVRTDASLGLSQGERVAFGVVVHAGLEAMVKGTAFAAAAAWTDATGLPAEGRAYELACAEAEAARADPLWPELFAAAARVEAELPIVHLDGASLVTGTLDLLVERRDGSLLVIDHKTTALAPPEDGGPYRDDELRELSRERGWTEQLGAYAAALRALRPGAPVEAAVYLTRLARLVSVPV